MDDNIVIGMIKIVVFILRVAFITLAAHQNPWLVVPAFVLTEFADFLIFLEVKDHIYSETHAQFLDDPKPVKKEIHIEEPTNDKETPLLPSIHSTEAPKVEDLAQKPKRTRKPKDPAMTQPRKQKRAVATKTPRKKSDRVS